MSTLEELIATLTPEKWFDMRCKWKALASVARSNGSTYLRDHPGYGEHKAAEFFEKAERISAKIKIIDAHFKKIEKQNEPK